MGDLYVAPTVRSNAVTKSVFIVLTVTVISEFFPKVKEIRNFSAIRNFINIFGDI